MESIDVETLAGILMIGAFCLSIVWATCLYSVSSNNTRLLACQAAPEHCAEVMNGK